MSKLMNEKILFVLYLKIDIKIYKYILFKNAL